MRPETIRKCAKYLYENLNESFDHVRKTNRCMLFRELIGVNWVKHVIHEYNIRKNVQVVMLK